MTIRNKIVIVALLVTLPVYLQAEDRALPETDDDQVVDRVEAGIEIEMQSNRSPFQVNLLVDLPIIASGILVGGAPVYMDIDMNRNLRLLDPGEINRFDRTALGNWSTTADLVSDGFLIAHVTLPFLLDFVDVMSSDSSDGLLGFGKDSIILLETLAVNCFAFNLFKFSVRRPRPYAYDPRHGLLEDDDYGASVSFFSGHTSLAFSMATSYSYLFSQRHPDSPLVIPVWIGSHALAVATAGLRVEAGKHFWTDIMAGAAIGSLIGFMVPYLHADPDPGEKQTGRLMVTPMFFEGGFGTSANWLF